MSGSTTQLQLRRGTTAQNDAFTGAQGEVTVDTDQHGLRVHDGVTPGGIPITHVDISPITDGTATDAGALTGVETVPLSRGSGLLQTTVAKIAAFTISVFAGFAPNYAGGIARTLQQILADNPVSVRGLGVKGDGATDDTLKLQAALNLGIPLYFPAGTYLYTANLTAYGALSGDGESSVLQCNTADGSAAALQWSNASHFKVTRIKFNNAHATAYIVNEGAGALKFTNCSYYDVTNCYFNNCASQAIMNRSGSYVRIDSNTFTNLWHDGVDVVKASYDVTITNNKVINGGDDAFAVVGYVGDGVRPKRVLISGNQVFGTKYARGVAIVGAETVTVYGNEIYNTQSAGLYLSAEAAYNTYGNDDVKVFGNVFDGCGINSSIAASPNGTYGNSNVASVYIAAYSGFNNNNIDIVYNTIRNASNTPILFNALGGLHHSVNVSGNKIRDNWDPLNKNGFQLATIAATSASPVLNFNVTNGVAVGMRAWLYDGTTYSTPLGNVLSATASSVTLDTSVTVPNGAKIVFSGIGLWGSAPATNAAIASGSTILSFASTTRIPKKDSYTISGAEGLTGISVGQGVTGTGIPAGTFVVGVTANNVVLSQATTGAIANGVTITFTPMLYFATQTLTTTAATASGTSLTFASGNQTKGVAVGQGVTGANIPAGTYVIAASGSAVTLSQAVTGTGVASGALITFVGTGSLTSGSAIAMFATTNGIVSKNQLISIAQYGLYVDGSCSGVIDLDGNTGENIGCVNAFSRFQTESSFAAGLLVRKRANFMQLPPGWPKAVDTFMFAPSGNWQYTEWHENNRVQNNAIGMNVSLTPAAQSVGASPWTFTNNNPSAVDLVLSGGIVSDISIKRNGQTGYSTGLSAGIIGLKAGDAVVVTYSSAPTATLIQRLGQ